MLKQKQLAQALSVVSIGVLALFIEGPLPLSRAAPTAPTFNVNSSADAVASAPLDNGVCETAPGNGVCTLRAAIMKANHYPGGGATIKFDLPGVVTYTLTIPPSDLNDEATGDLNITNTLTIIGSGAANTIIDGNGTDRVFNISAPQGVPVASISGVTIKNGHASTCDAFLPAVGGGIANDGVLTVTNSTITGNTVNCSTARGAFGGGIFSSRKLTLNNSLISENTANGSAGQGGGIYTQNELLLVNSTVSGNTSTSNGGGLSSTFLSSATISNSTVNGNKAGGNGGGIFHNSPSTLVIINSTISGNSSDGYGGGIYHDHPNGTASLFNVTLTSNLANADSSGAGIGGGVANVSGAFNFQNSIIGGNYTVFVSGFPVLNPEDCAGTITSQGNNILATTTDCTVSDGEVRVTDPMLGPLANNGGSTQTHALLTGSPAIDAGGCTDNLGMLLATDQRGFHRPVFGESALRCDIGAFELQRLLYLPLIMRE